MVDFSVERQECGFDYKIDRSNTHIEISKYQPENSITRTKECSTELQTEVSIFAQKKILGDINNIIEDNYIDVQIY